MDKNRFVVIFEESYDQYCPEVPHPVVTHHTKGEILKAFKGRLRAVAEYFEWYREARRQGETPNWCPPYMDSLLDTGLTYDAFEVGNPDTLEVTVQVLTIDEWFEKYGNRRFNDVS